MAWTLVAEANTDIFGDVLLWPPKGTGFLDESLEGLRVQSSLNGKLLKHSLKFFYFSQYLQSHFTIGHNAK